MRVEVREKEEEEVKKEVFAKQRGRRLKDIFFF